VAPPYLNTDSNVATISPPIQIPDYDDDIW
jgi:hypothetical protein